MGTLAGYLGGRVNPAFFFLVCVMIPLIVLEPPEEPDSAVGEDLPAR